MTDTNEILSLLVAQVDGLTTQIAELTPLKNVCLARYRHLESEKIQLLIARMNTLRQLAKTTLDTPDHSGDIQGDDTK